ncbi:MAG TPA: DUF6049 family protein, partial [Ilumatobacteraceae bacterium]
LADTSVADMSARVKQLAITRLMAANVASMLVTDNGRHARWDATLDTLQSTAITDAQVTATLTKLAAEFNTITSAVVLHKAYAFTLSGLSSDLPLRIENTSDEPLKVLIAMAAGADKLSFPKNHIVTLDPHTVNQVPIHVHARANGTSTVTLNVLTPGGNQPVVPFTTLKVTVNQLTGLAQVLTGGGLLIIATWWVRNVRRTRRARRSAAAMEEHPARAAARTDPSGAASASLADS